MLGEGVIGNECKRGSNCKDEEGKGSSMAWPGGSCREQRQLKMAASPRFPTSSNGIARAEQ
jgi:hypothetical protein